MREKRNVAKGLRAIYVEQDPVYPGSSDRLRCTAQEEKIDEISDEVHRWEVISKLNEYIIHLFGLNADASSKVFRGREEKGALALAFRIGTAASFVGRTYKPLDIDAIFKLEELILSNFRKNRTL